MYSALSNKDIQIYFKPAVAGSEPTPMTSIADTGAMRLYGLDSASLQATIDVIDTTSLEDSHVSEIAGKAKDSISIEGKIKKNDTASLLKITRGSYGYYAYVIADGSTVGHQMPVLVKSVETSVKSGDKIPVKIDMDGIGDTVDLPLSA